MRELKGIYFLCCFYCRRRRCRLNPIDIHLIAYYIFTDSDSIRFGTNVYMAFKML